MAKSYQVEELMELFSDQPVARERVRMDALSRNYWRAQNAQLGRAAGGRRAVERRRQASATLSAQLKQLRTASDNLTDRSAMRLILRRTPGWNRLSDPKKKRAIAAALRRVYLFRRNHK